MHLVVLQCSGRAHSYPLSGCIRLAVSVAALREEFRLMLQKSSCLGGQRSSLCAVPVGGLSDSVDRVDAAAVHGGDEFLVVLVVLVGVTLREVSDRLVEAVVRAEVLGQRHRVT